MFAAWPLHNCFPHQQSGTTVAFKTNPGVPGMLTGRSQLQGTSPFFLPHAEGVRMALSDRSQIEALCRKCRMSCGADHRKLTETAAFAKTCLRLGAGVVRQDGARVHPGCTQTSRELGPGGWLGFSDVCSFRVWLWALTLVQLVRCYCKPQKPSCMKLVTSQRSGE